MTSVRPLLGVAVLAATLPLSVPVPIGRADPSPPAAAKVIRTGRLGVGGTAFWSGPNGAPSSCTSTTAPCWDYEIEVRSGGARLRVAVDHATVGDVFRLEVRGPDDRSDTVSPGDGLYSAEAFFSEPAAGRWRVRVVADNVRDLRFRVRAKLEGAPPPERHVQALPNLQVLAPYDFTFLTPVTNGSTGGPPQGVPGPTSCHPEETAEERAVRCLRMAFGVRNTGQGPMQLYYGTGAQGADRPLFQRVRYADGGYVDRPAGVARWHATHGHYHHHDAVALQLLEVTDPAKGTLAAATPERRKGFAHRSEMMREWNRFYPTWPDYGFGLEAGWGDWYEWDRPGNFLDFGLHGDGWYLVRMVADPDNGVLESNERDNVGYTYFRVTGTTVQAVESGRGTSPWDRCKIVTPIGAEPAPPPGKRAPRPRTCPPDTV